MAALQYEGVAARPHWRMPPRDCDVAWLWELWCFGLCFRVGDAAFEEALLGMHGELSRVLLAKAHAGARHGRARARIDAWRAQVRRNRRSENAWRWVAAEKCLRTAVCVALYYAALTLCRGRAPLAAAA